jgi:hypothetical protein
LDEGEIVVKLEEIARYNATELSMFVLGVNDGEVNETPNRSYRSTQVAG